MKTKILKHFILAVCLSLLPMAMMAKQEATVSSPSGNITLTTGVDNAGRPYYSLNRGKEEILLRSALGLKLKDGDLSNDFRLIGFSRATKDETWHQPWGEEDDVRNHYNELTMKLAQKKGLQRQLTIVFRVFDDGMGFRYVFPQQKNLSDFIITDELTEFCFKGDPEAWTLPFDADYYEGLWKKAPLSKKQKVCTPVTIEAKPDLYMMLHEANLTDYSSLNVKPIEAKEGYVRLKAELVPWSNGDLVRAKAPFVSPWRMLSVEDHVGGLITNRVMLNLNDPCKIKDTSWITTGKYVGVWWTYHMQHATWGIGPKHGATTENTKRYIDFAAEHGFKGVLVEGWNYGWENDWGKEGDKFNFTKPYPDYDFDGLQKYALLKGVSLIAHNETGGAAKNYEEQLEAAFSLYEKMGIKAIKTGYVNKVMDNKELQHSQYGVRHYRKVIEAAARHHIMVVNHEPAMPTGLQRTYPNLIASEGVRGQEWNAWDGAGGNPPYHLCVLPFTRQLAGPIDFTPGIFKLEGQVYAHTHPHTTLAKQLAEYVVIYTPWQMAADEIKNYKDQPAFTFIEAMPSNWQKTVIPMAEIGKYIVTARQNRDNQDWFVGGMTDENARDISLKLDFLAPGTTYKAIIYKDGPDAEYDKNPYPMTIEQLVVNHDSVLKLHMAKSGGFAIQLIKQV